MSSTIRGSLLAGAGVISLAVAALIPAFRLPALLVALILLFLAATSLSRATRIADSLPPLANRLVQVRVWGNALPVEAALEVDSIRSFGAALLIHLRPAGGGARHLLKVAQPGPGRVQPGRLEIPHAAYISWAGTKLHRDVERQQMALVLLWPDA
jgi:hypothetical protein